MANALRGARGRVERGGFGAFFVLELWFAACCVLASAGCSSHRPGTGCVQGLIASCTCDDKRQGVQVCQEDNTFGACRCPSGSTGAGGSGGGAGRSGSGGTGTAGKGTGGAISPAAGRSASTGGTGGAGGAGVSGMNGQSGRGGSSGRSGSSGAGGVVSTVAAFSACSQASSCGADQTCVFGAQQANMVGYCSPSCATVRPCPQPTSGTVRATCNGALCTLGSCERLQCPDGMMCVQSGGRMGMTNGFSCVYPMR